VSLELGAGIDRRRLPHGLLCGAACEQTFGFVRAFGTGEFTWSPSLQTASVTGTATGGGFEVTVDMSWEGTGPIETTQNTTTRPGFVGHFTGKERDAAATGTVVRRRRDRRRRLDHECVDRDTQGQQHHDRRLAPGRTGRRLRARRPGADRPRPLESRPWA
jgi:hypothetical protein